MIARLITPASDSATPDLDEIWQRIQREVCRALPQPAYRLWIEPVRAVGVSGDRLLLSAPASVRSWVERRYADQVTLAMSSVAPQLRAFAFVGLGETPGEEAGDGPSMPRLTFRDFVLGPSNRLAHAAALRVAEDPGTAYNPFFLWGPPGIGKTHLIAALAGYALEINPELRVRYLTSERFTEEFVAAVRGSGTGPMRERLRKLDLLVIDDVHYLSGRAKTQLELIHAFDALLAHGSQIVVASEQPPLAIEGLTEGLRDRFDSGLSVEMTRPDLATRLAVVSRTVGRARFPAPDIQTLTRVAELAPSNFRRLEAAMTRVLAHASLLGRQPSPELAEEALRPDHAAVPDPTADEPDVEEIIAAVCQTQHISAGELRSRRRAPDAVRARRVAMYLAREAGLSLAEIGRAFGRDHSTVISALRTVERNLEPGDEVHTAVESARQALHSPAS